MKNRKILINFLFFSILFISFLGATCKQYVNSYSATTRAILLGTKATLDSTEELYVAYYDITYSRNLEDLDNGVITKEEYLLKKEELTDLDKKVRNLFRKAYSLQNASVTLLMMIEQGIKDKNEGRVELEGYLKKLNDLILEINQTLKEFNVIPSVIEEDVNGS